MDQAHENTSSASGLTTIGLSSYFLQQRAAWAAAGPGRDAEAPLFRITEVQREGITLHDGQHSFGARLRPALREQLVSQADAVAVGDWVLADRNPEGDWWVHERLTPVASSG